MFGGSRINTTRKPIKAVVGGFGGLLHGHKAFPQFLNFTLDILHVRFDFGHSIPDVFQLHNCSATRFLRNSDRIIEKK